MSYKNSYEGGIYSSDMTKLGDSVLQSMQETIQKKRRCRDHYRVL